MNETLLSIISGIASGAAAGGLVARVSVRKWMNQSGNTQHVSGGRDATAVGRDDNRWTGNDNRGRGDWKGDDNRGRGDMSWGGDDNSWQGNDNRGRRDRRR